MPPPAVGAAPAAGDPVVAGDALKVAVTVDPGAGERPTAPAGDIPGARAGDMPTAGGGIGAPGCAGMAGLGWPAGGGGFPGAVGTFAFGGGGGGGGACRC